MSNFYNSEIKKMDNEVELDKIRVENYKNEFINYIQKINKSEIKTQLQPRKLKKPLKLRLKYNFPINATFSFNGISSENLTCIFLKIHSRSSLSV